MGYSRRDRDIKDKILNWFGTGQIGASSKAMALAAVGVPNDGSHPHDPGDLNRCLMLLDSVPEIRLYMDKVAAMSDTWNILVERWDEVEQCFISEAGLNWRKSGHAPRTYDLMKTIGC